MSDIRKFFRSRYPNGYIVEADFSQLEIYALAWLSGDEQLKADLLSGVDRHAISAEALFGPKYTPAQRKIAKQLSFQLQYGAGAKSMAEKNKIPIQVARKYIKTYYDRYPKVQEYQEKLIEEAKLNRHVNPARRTKKGFPAGEWYLKSCTGRQYLFVEEDTPDWMRTGGPRFSAPAPNATFSPTKLKNYQVQGFATGDIVPLVLGKLYRRLKETSWGEHCLMVNTVHDSVMFDCQDREWAVSWGRVVKRIMERAPKYLKEVFDIDFDLPLPVEVKIGPSWGELEKLDI